MRQLLFISSVACALYSSAAADTAYIEPSTYAPSKGQMITLEVSFNDYCCEPKYAVRSENYAVIAPDGVRSVPDRIEVFSTSTVVEHAIQSLGTTRFTTGERLGRKGEYVFLNGEYMPLTSEDGTRIEVPDNIPVLSSQTATVSDTYITIGAPSWASIEHQIGRLIITPSQHPSTLQKGDTLTISVMFDDAAVSGQSVLVTRANQQNRLGDNGLTFITDSDGSVDIPLEHIGTHLIMTRLQAPASIGAETDIRSYTTSLTFDVGE